MNTGMAQHFGLLQSLSVLKSGGPILLMRYRVWAHIAFWLLYYLFIAVILCWGLYNIVDPYFYVRLLLFFPISAALVYGNLYFLIPRLLYQARYVSYLSSLTAAVAMTALCTIVLRKVLVMWGVSFYVPVASFHYKLIISEWLNEFYLVCVTSGIKFLKDWLLLQQRGHEQETKLLQTELNFLKSQIQPHFFFNTLNNLYALTLTKSDAAPEVVLRLAGLMRYLLYECDQATVALSKELEHLEHYIELEKLRFGKRVVINYTFQGPVDHIQVPPFIFLSFVENSFKHGVGSPLDRVIITITLQTSASNVYFQVKNPVSTVPMAPGGGIGLKNVQRRLELVYGTYFDLQITRDKDYRVSLKLPAA